MRILSTLVVAATVAIASPLHALDFEFEFTGDDFIRGGVGSVSGRILGLQDNIADQTATAVIVDEAFFGDGSAADLGLLSSGPDAALWGTIRANAISVFGGNISSVNFISVTTFPSATNVPGAVSEQDLFGLTDDGFALVINQQGGADFDLFGSPSPDHSLTFTQISAVPLPGAFGLLATAMAGIGLLGRKKFRRA